MSITGLFEIHITIDHKPEGAAYRFTTFTLTRPDVKRTVAINPRGTWDTQYMFTKWTNGTEAKAIERAHALGREVEAHGLSIARLKVEARASDEGVKEAALVREDCYFEFHTKILLGSHTAADLEEAIEDLQCDASPDTTSGVSFNLTGTAGLPILDLRVVPSAGYAFAVAQKDYFLEGLKALGYDISGTIQAEYVILDTHKDLDQGWM
jgi:hypothetical protein